MDFEKRLIEYGRKTITREALSKVCFSDTDEQLYEIVQQLTNAGLLQPITGSKTNGNRRYLLYQKYRITLKAESYKTELIEISTLHPALQKSGVLQKSPAQYIKYRKQLKKLDTYLFHQTAKPEPVSRKERSFEVFSEEKSLDDTGLCALLARLGLGAEALAYYDTPEFCFNDYIPKKKRQMTLLICENKDIWFNIRRRMYEDGAGELFGVALDGVVYGCGNRISARNALSGYTDFLGAEQVAYLYWGDIDRSGLAIYQNLLHNNPDLSIRLFTQAYEEMLRLAKGCTIPNSEDERTLVENYEALFAQVAEELQADFRYYVLKRKRVPQEIISYAKLITDMR